MHPAAKNLLKVLQPYVPDGSDVLASLLAKNQDSAFGKEHRFASISTITDFQNNVPIRNYDDLTPWIDRIAAGEQGVLTTEAVLFFEPTSGTSGARKLIPITRTFQEELARALAIWFNRWQKNCPEVFAGRAYWAISPQNPNLETTAGGIAIGATSDAAYFPDEVGQAIADWLVVQNFSPSQDFFEVTASKLLATQDISLISSWSPTFLLSIDNALKKLGHQQKWKQLWPSLQRVSCWTEGQSALWIDQLSSRMGEVAIEGKGLLSTEGVTTIPEVVGGGSSLAEGCHFYEFMDIETGRLCDFAGLHVERDYEVILTTGAGLYRYRCGDVVRMIRYNSRNAAVFEFVGRHGKVSDLVGEKMSESFVSATFASVGARGFLQAVTKRPGYVLWLEHGNKKALVQKLEENPHFKQATQTGQLSPIEVRHLTANWQEKYILKSAKKNGSRLGEVKVPSLLLSHEGKEVEQWLG